MNQLYNQIMHTLSDKIKSRKQNQNTSENNVINTIPYQITIGCASFKTQILSLDPRQLHDQFIDKMLTISQHQFNKSFKNNFPFFMMDFIKLYKRIQKKFKQISYKQQQFLVQKHTYCLKYEKLLKKKLFSDKNNVIIQTQQLVDVQQDQNIKQKIKTIFKYMIQCRAWDLRTKIIEINILKHISHVNFTVLKSIKTLNSPIQSLQPLIWMDLPELQLLQIGLLCSTSIKPLGRCSLQSLRQMKIQYIFEYNENRMYQSKKSVDISPLSRLKLKQSLFQRNKIHTSTLYLYDSKKLTKIEWRIFDFPLISSNDYYIIPSPSFTTYNPTVRQYNVMKDRARGYKIQSQTIKKQPQMKQEQEYNQIIQLNENIVKQKEQNREQVIKQEKIQVQNQEQKRQIIKEDNDQQKQNEIQIQKQDVNIKQTYKRQRLVDQSEIKQNEYLHEQKLQLEKQKDKLNQQQQNQVQKLNKQRQYGQQQQIQKQKNQQNEQQQKEQQNQNQDQQQQQQNEEQDINQNINIQPIQQQVNQQGRWIQIEINQQQWQQDYQYQRIQLDRPQLFQAINIGKSLIFYQYNSNSIDQQMSAQQQQ